MSNNITKFQNKPAHKEWEGYHSSDKPIFLGSAPNTRNPDEMCDMYLRLSINHHKHQEFEIATISQSNGQEDFRATRNQFLSHIDCEKILEAIQNPETVDHLDNEHKALYLAIDSGHLPAPKEYVIGNSFIKDRQYKLSIAGTEPEGSFFHKLPDFYTFDDEKEAKQFCKPGVGVYEKVTAINEYHLQIIASGLRLDSKLENTNKEAVEQKENKFRKFSDSVMSQYLTSNKSDVITKIKNSLDSRYIEPDSLKSFVKGKVELLTNKPELLESMMGQSPLFNASREYINDNFPDSLPLSLKPEEVRDLITDKYKLDSISTSIVVDIAFNLAKWDRDLSTEGEKVDKWLSEPQNSAKVIKQLLSTCSQKKSKDISSALDS